MSSTKSPTMAETAFVLKKIYFSPGKLKSDMAKGIIFKTVNNNGEYSCEDIGISTSDWYELLKDDNAKPYIDALLCFLREPKHTGSCKNVSKKYGYPAQHFNSKITNFSKWVQKKLNRFQIKGTDDKDIYWCITMKKGWESEQGFLWQMRDELVKALQRYLMKELIQDYRTREPFNGHDEEYKWALLDKAEGKDVQGIISCLRGQNVVYNAQVDGILKTLWETKPNELTTCIDNLLDETRALIPRIGGFRDEMRDICPSEWKSCANDERTASAILTCRYPNEYTFYKSEVYQVICKYFGFEYREAYLKFAHFTEIINDFVADFGEEIQQIMMPQIGKYKNKPLNLAVQTLFWCMKEEMKATTQSNYNLQEAMPENKYQEYIDLLETNKNLILTGAPGTGKTYLAKEIARKIIENDFLIRRYYTSYSDEFTNFVQFHPSYDYVDFVEGLRPQKNDGQIGFERVDGTFKMFCKRAVMYPLAFTHKESNTIHSFSVFPEIIMHDFANEISPGISVRCEDEFDIKVRYQKQKEILYYIKEGKEIVYSDRAILSIFMYLLQHNISSLYGYDCDSKKFKMLVHNAAKHSRPHVLLSNGDMGTWIETYSILDDKDEDDICANRIYYIALIERMLQYAQKRYVPLYNKFVFIIDEINRGEISKIFGELFFSIDPGYRGEKGRVNTQYQNMIEEGDVFKEGFYVPENVYIIGTMNDIDRSVESMDFAMRRRFTWKEVTPADTEYMLDTLDCAAEAKATMNRLNKVIEETEGLGAAYMIGPAYFLKLGEHGGDFDKLWKTNIEPLLKEYLRGFRKTKDILEKFSMAYFNQIDED